MNDAPSSTMYVGTGAAVIFGLTLGDIIAIIAAVIGLAGFGVNTWHKWKIRQMERERLDFEMRRGSQTGAD